MTDWMEGTLSSLVDEKARYVFSLTRRENTKALLAQCRREVGSHVEAIGERGWMHVRAGDEYSPFEYGDYAIFTASGNSMSVQLAVSSNSNKMYVAGYILERDGWYDWEEYKVEFAENDSDNKKTKALSFKQALEDARQRSRKKGSTANGDSEDKYPKSKIKDLFKNRSEKAVVNTGFKEGVKERIGMNLYSEDAVSTENSRYIVVEGISGLEELKNKIIAIKSNKRFLSIGKALPITLNIKNIGSAPIKFSEPKIACSSNMEMNIYFVTYDGADFVYCGRLNK